MAYVVYIAVYILIGLLSEYMKGYADPLERRITSTSTDWISMFAWPYNFPSTVGNYGAAKRLASPGN